MGEQGLPKGAHLPTAEYLRHNDTRPTISSGTVIYLLDEFEFSARAENILRAEGILTLAQLLERSEAELLRIPNCGKVTVREFMAAANHFQIHGRGAPDYGWC